MAVLKNCKGLLLTPVRDGSGTTANRTRPVSAMTDGTRGTSDLQHAIPTTEMRDGSLPPQPDDPAPDTRAGHKRTRVQVVADFILGLLPG